MVRIREIHIVQHLRWSISCMFAVFVFRLYLVHVCSVCVLHACRCVSFVGVEI